MRHPRSGRETRSSPGGPPTPRSSPQDRDSYRPRARGGAVLYLDPYVLARHCEALAQSDRGVREGRVDRLVAAGVAVGVGVEDLHGAAAGLGAAEDAVDEDALATGGAVVALRAACLEGERAVASRPDDRQLHTAPASEGHRLLDREDGGAGRGHP